MNLFELEQQLQKEHGDFNAIKISNGNVYITSHIGRSCLSEVNKKKRVVYKSVQELFEKSNQLVKNSKLTTLIIEMIGTDAKKYKLNVLC